jgi:hypothetical protein
MAGGGDGWQICSPFQRLKMNNGNAGSLSAADDNHARAGKEKTNGNTCGNG